MTTNIIGTMILLFQATITVVILFGTHTCKELEYQSKDVKSIETKVEHVQDLIRERCRG